MTSKAGFCLTTAADNEGLHKRRAAEGKRLTEFTSERSLGQFCVP